jgi:hypothetical protein
MAKPGIGLPVQFTSLGWHATFDAHKPNASRQPDQRRTRCSETITITGDDVRVGAKLKAHARQADVRVRHDAEQSNDPW